MKKLTEINFGKKFHTATEQIEKSYSQNLVKQTVDLFRLLNCLFLFFIHLKLELLTQIPASNGKKDVHLWKIAICKIELFNYKLEYLSKNFVDFSVILFVQKLAWNRIYMVPAAEGLIMFSLNRGLGLGPI